MPEKYVLTQNEKCQRSLIWKSLQNSIDQWDSAQMVFVSPNGSTVWVNAGDLTVSLQQQQDITSVSDHWQKTHIEMLAFPSCCDEPPTPPLHPPTPPPPSHTHTGRLRLDQRAFILNTAGEVQPQHHRSPSLHYWTAFSPTTIFMNPSWKICCIWTCCRLWN